MQSADATHTKSRFPLRDTALRLLKMREHTCFELKQKLLKRGFAAAQVLEMLDYLKQHDLQSDTRFCQFYVQGATAKGDGRLKIAANMYRKGIADGLITQFLPTDSTFWERQLLKKWNNKCLLAKKDDKSYAKVVRFLQGRGFTLAQIKACVQK